MADRLNTMLRTLLFSFGLVLALSACSGKPRPQLDNAEFWQRSGMVDSIYVRGPKAQQMLNRDIAHCVAEGREMVRTGALRDSLSTDLNHAQRRHDERELYKWDTPERDRYMFTEHSNYHDFEGCMQAAGWERRKYVPFEKVDEYEKSYYDAHADFEYQSRKAEQKRQDAMYNDLND